MRTLTIAGLIAASCLFSAPPAHAECGLSPDECYELAMHRIELEYLRKTHEKAVMEQAHDEEFRFMGLYKYQDRAGKDRIMHTQKIATDMYVGCIKASLGHCEEKLLHFWQLTNKTWSTP
jgi:hypothetical protein